MTNQPNESEAVCRVREAVERVARRYRYSASMAHLTDNMMEAIAPVVDSLTGGELAAELDVAIKEAVDWWFAWRNQHRNPGTIDRDSAIAQMTERVQRKAGVRRTPQPRPTIEALREKAEEAAEQWSNGLEVAAIHDMANYIAALKAAREEK